MRVKISVKDLLGAFALADSGAKTTVRKVSRSETERIPALLTFEARCTDGGSLKLRTLGKFPAADVTTSVIVDAIVDEEGVHSCDLEDARAAFGRLKKTAKRGTLVELSSDDRMNSIAVKSGNATARIPKDYDSRVEAFEDALTVAVVPPSDIKAALDMSKGMKLGIDGSLYGHVVSFGDGVAVAMDNRNAELLAVPTVPEEIFPVHVPRQVLAVLARSSEPARIADGYASSGMARVRWRLVGNRIQADGMFSAMRRLACGKFSAMRRLASGMFSATTLDGGELRQALTSLSAFMAKGDVISLIPDECGVRILRYDVRDNAHDLYVTRKVCVAPNEWSDRDVVVESRQVLADCAEVLVGALWPLPHPISLSASRLERVLGDADGIDMFLDDDPGGLVVAHVHGDPVVHLMCQSPCPFKGVDTI